MEFLGTRRIKVKNGGKIRLYFPGDFHYGNRSVDKQAARRLIKRVANDPDGYAILMGDIIDGITYRDRKHRFNPEAVDPDIVSLDKINVAVDEELRYAANELKPLALKNKLWGMVAGNHDDDVADQYGVAAMQRLASEMRLGAHEGRRVWTTQRCGWVKVQFNLARDGRGRAPLVVHVLAHHGWGGGRTPGTKLNKVVALANNFPDFEIVAMGHVHDPVIKVEARGHVRNERIAEKPCVLLLTGAWMKNWPEHKSYQEDKAYPFVAMGCPCVEMEVRRTSQAKYVILRPSFETRTGDGRTLEQDDATIPRARRRTTKSLKSGKAKRKSGGKKGKRKR